jgi:acylphosphatase
MAEERLHATVRGRVQMVGFRAFTERRAVMLGLKGYVRNTFDDAVEVVAEGPRAHLERLLGELRRGPSGAYVAAVDAQWSDATGEFRSFRVTY